MSDIDFDELDKAVNSLMGSVKPEKSDDNPQLKTISINSTLKPGEKPAHDKLDEIAKTIGSETLTPGDDRRTVVNDLDAAKSDNPAEMPQAAIQSPEAVPEPPVVTEEVAATPPDPEPSRQEEPKPEEPKVPKVSRPASGRFMDVVHPSSDMRTPELPALKVPERASSAKVAPTPSVAPSVAADVDEPSRAEASIAADAPLTPFLPDVEVEKRPLGEPTTQSGAIETPFEDTVDKVADTAIETEPQKDLEETVPSSPEIDKEAPADEQEVVAASSSTENEAAESADLTAIESSEVTSVPLETDETIRSVESGDTEKLLTATKTSAVAGHDNSAEGSIYDVANQPQPLNHPTQQKSGWGVVIIIIVIILLAVGLGAAAYFILGLGA